MNGVEALQRQWAAEAKAKAKKKKASSGGGGILDDITGGISHAFGKVGIGGLGKILWNAPSGMLNTFILGPAHGIVNNDWSLDTTAAKGLASGVENTLSIGTAPAAAALGAVSGRNFSNKNIWHNVNEQLGLSGPTGKTYTPQPFWNNPEGYAPGLFNDFMNLSIAGSGAKAALLGTGGDVAKVAAADVAAETAGRAGTEGALKAATKAEEGSPGVFGIGKRTGAAAARENLGEAGLQQAEESGQMGRYRKAFTATEMMQHPLRETFNRVVRPAGLAARATQVGNVGAEAEALAARDASVAEARAQVARGEAPPEAVKTAYDAGEAARVEAAQTGTYKPPVAPETPPTEGQVPGTGTPPEPPQAPTQALHDEYLAQHPELGVKESQIPPHAGDYPPEEMSQVAQQYLHGPDLTGTPEAEATYGALKNETLSQAATATGGPVSQWVSNGRDMVTPNNMRLTYVDESAGPAYSDAAAMREDLANGHLTVRHTLGSEDVPNKYMGQPVLGANGQPIMVPVTTAAGIQEMPLTYNDVFRPVHDIYGHAAANDFGQAGELTAWRIHQSLYSPEAQQALANETIGQTAALGETGDFPPQRVPQIDPELLSSLRHPERVPEAGAEETLPTEAGAEELRGAETPQAHEDLLNQVPQYRRLAYIATHELPGWSQTLVSHMPRPLVEIVAKMDRAIQWHDASVLTRQIGRMMDASRVNELHSEAVQIMAQDIGRQLVGQTLDTGVVINRAIASQLVGAEIISRVTGSNLEAVFPEVKNSTIVQEATNRIASQGNRIPKNLIEDLGLEGKLDEAATAVKTQADARLEALRQSRLGNEGLPVEGEGQRLSAKEAKMVAKIKREIKKMVTLQKQADKEVNQAVVGVDETINSVNRLTDEHDRFMDQAAAHRGEAGGLYEAPIPTENPVIQQALPTIAEDTLDSRGGTYNVFTGEKVAEPYTVSIKEGTLVEVAKADFEADPIRYLNQALADPVFQMPWVHLGTWLDDSGQVHIDPSITEWPKDITNPGGAMVKLDRGTGWLLGVALKQDTIFAAQEGGMNGALIQTLYDETAQHLATHFVDQALNHSSQFSTFMRELHKAAEEARIHAIEKAANGEAPAETVTHAQVDADMVNHMSAAYAEARGTGQIGEDGKMSPKSVEDYFQKRRIEYRKGTAAQIQKGAGRALNQVVLRLNLDSPTLVSRIAEQLGPQYEAATQWYHDSHKAIERYRGQTITLGDGTQIDAADLMHQLVAVTSIKSQPITNLGNAMNAMANWTEWQAAGDAAFKEYSAGMDRFLRLPAEQRTMDTLVNTILKDVPKEERTYSEPVQRIGGGRGEIPPGEKAPPPPSGTGMHGNEGAHLKALTAILSGHTLDKWTPEDLLNLNVAWGGKVKVLGKNGTIEDLMADIPEHVQDQARMEADANAGGPGLGTAEEVAQRAVALQHGTNAWAKILSFWQNLANPQTGQAVTLDSWMARAFGYKDWMSPGDYAEVSAKMQKLAADAGIMPHELQAAIWVLAKQRITALTSERVWGAATLAMRQAKDSDFQFGVPGDPIYDMLARNLEPTPKGPSTASEPLAEAFGRKVRRGQVSLRNSDFATGQARLDAYVKDAQEWNNLRAEAPGHLFPEDVSGKVSTWASKHAKAVQSVEDAASLEDIVGNPNERIAQGMERTGYPGRATQVAADFDGQFDGLAQEVEGRVLGQTLGSTPLQPALIRLFKGADFHTLLHEEIHVLRDTLKPEEQQAVAEALGYDKHLFSRRLDDPFWGGLKRQAEEDFVDATLGYIFSHGDITTAPAGLRPIIDNVRSNMVDLWNSYSHTRDAEWSVPPGLADIWDEHFNPQIDAANAPNELSQATSNAEAFRRTLPQDWTAEQAVARNRALPSETIEQALARQKKMGSLIEKAHIKEVAAQARLRRIARMQINLDKMANILSNGGEDATIAMLKRSENRIGNLSDKLAASMANPSVRNVPAKWQPMWETIKTLHKEAADDPVLASHLEGIPENFATLLRRAQELGFDPTHVRDFGPKQVNNLVHGMMDLGATSRRVGEEFKAGTRSARTSGIARTQSIDALIAATNEVMHEHWTNNLVDYFDKYGALPIPHGGIPKGWVEWDATRRTIVNGEEALTETGGRAVKPEPQYMIPKVVDDALQRMGKSYNHPLLRALQKGTGIWRTFILALSPRWYVHTTLGTALLSVLAGARFQDFAAAWDAYRSDKAGQYGDMIRMDRQIAGENVMTTTGRRAVGGQTLYHDITGGEGNSIITNRTGPKGFVQDVKEASGTIARVKRTEQSLMRVHDSINQFVRSATYHANYRITADPVLALQEASRALVDYGDLSPFERSIVRSVIPFYSWIKGVLKVAAHVAYDHPIVFGVMDRLAWANAEVQRDKYGGGLPDAYSGVVDAGPLGDLNTAFMNPFASGARTLTPSGIADAMNPFIKAVLASQMGASSQVFSTNNRMDNYGRLVPDVPVSAGLGDIVGSVPVLDTALSATGGQAYQPAYGEGVAGGSVQHFFGSPAIPPSLLNKVVARTRKTEKALSGKKKGRKKKVQTPFTEYMKKHKIKTLG